MSAAPEAPPKPRRSRAQRRAPAGGASGRTGRPSADELPQPDRPIASLPFVLVIAGVLAGGLLALLMINNALAAGSFEQARLKADATLLAEQEQALTQEVERLSSPTRLRQAAKDLGLIPAAATAYLDLTDGRILGTPLPAGGPYSTVPADDPESGAQNPDGSDGAVRILQPRGRGARPLEDPEELTQPGDGGDGAAVAPDESAYDRAVVRGER